MCIGGVMTYIRATCPTCGDVRILASKVTLLTTIGLPGGQYRWTCDCGIVIKSCEQSIVDVLRSSHIREEVTELPLELMERPLDGVLTTDALIDLELAFQDGSI